MTTILERRKSERSHHYMDFGMFCIVMIETIMSGERVESSNIVFIFCSKKAAMELKILKPWHINSFNFFFC